MTYMARGFAQDQRERLADAIRRYLMPRFGENQSDVARLLGTSPGNISRILDGKSGGSPQLAREVEKHTPVTADEILWGRGGERQSPIGEMKGYAAAEEAARDLARTRRQEIPDWAWGRVADIQGRALGNALPHPTLIVELALHALNNEAPPRPRRGAKPISSASG